MEFQEHQKLNLPVQPSSNSLSSAELPQVESECPACQLLLRYPQRLTCCQRRFCGECIEKLLKDGKPCPSCNEADFSTLPDDSDERLGLKSTNKDEGVGELASDLEEHANSKPSPESQLDGCPQDHPPVQASKPPHHTQGRYDSEFVREQSECPICLQVLRDPQKVTCCGYIYCKVCIDRVVKDGKPCPTCNSTFLDSSPPSRDDQPPEDSPVQPARPDPPVQRSRPLRPSSRALPCGYDCEFVERPPAQVQCECPVCLQVLRDPQQVTCCGNSFCKVCIDRVVKHCKHCPICNKAFSIFQNQGLRRTLGGFRVYCSNKDEGCEWVGELGDIERHLNSKPSPKRQLKGCLFEEVACVYCTCLFQRRYIHDHQSNKCPKRQYSCNYCGEVDSYENITEIHSQKCPSFPIACHQHCGENVQRQKMDYHVNQVCSMTIVDCDYQEFGCEVRPARKDLPTHITESVADHTAMLAKSMRKVEDSATAQSNALQDNVTELLDTVSKQQTLITSLQSENKELKTESADEKLQNREHVDQLGRESAERINQLKRENSVEVSVVKCENRERVDQLQRENDDCINQLRREHERVADHTAMLAKSMRKVEDSTRAQSSKLKNSVTELLDTVSKQQTLITSLQNENKEFKTESADEKFQNREHFDQLGRENTEHINRLQRKNDDRTNQIRRENDEKFMVIKRQHFQHMFLGLAVVLAIAAIAIGIGIGVVSAQFNNTFLLHTVLENKTHDLITQTSKLKDELEELGGVKDDLSAKLEDLQDVQDLLASLEVQLQTEIDRKMTDFEKNKTVNVPWFSLPFYTHTRGYKMCIRVDANGHGNGAGTHVSVFLVLMSGIFDDDLEWPFQGNVTIELVNQLNPTSHLVKEVHFSRTSEPAIVGKVTSGDRAAKGRGWPKFIARSELDHNAATQTQYLKHDSLIFRISKVKNELSAKIEYIREFAKNNTNGLKDIQEFPERNMNNLTGKLEDLQDVQDSFEVQLQTEIDRKMTDFKKNKAANAEWYSPPFYTHTRGYKMCIRVDANGNGDGAGTHVSVYLYLMPGMFDDDLEWPFQGNVTIELVNRLNHTSNLVVRDLYFSPSLKTEIVGKVTSGDRAASGWGWPKFIAHSELDHNAATQTQYLKHDSLIFRISKVKNELSAKLEHIQEFAKKNVNSLEGKVQDVQDSFASLEFQLETEIDRKMTDFEKTKTAEAQWYSQPFYTHTRGYKMCINVIANGYGDGAGTHVSVYLVLMPGMFDDDLKWPFQGDITIELVNRLNSTSNLSHVARFSQTSHPAIVDKVISGDRAASGSGRTMFIAHSELTYNADEQTEYLKHDSLIFRISKVANVK